MDRRFPAWLKKPVRPTTAFNFSSASVTAGSSRFTRLAFRACTTLGGRASRSTFRPTARAVLGLTPGPTPPGFRAFDGPVELKRVAPEGLVSKRVETENLPIIFDHVLGVLADDLVEVLVLLLSGRRKARGEHHGAQEADEEEGETDDCPTILFHVDLPCCLTVLPRAPLARQVVPPLNPCNSTGKI